MNNNVANIGDILLQSGLVGAFIVFAIVSLRAFLDALEKQQIRFEERNKAMIEAMNNLNLAICGKIQNLDEHQTNHDQFVRERLTPASRKPG